MNEEERPCIRYLVMVCQSESLSQRKNKLRVSQTDFVWAGKMLPEVNFIEQRLLPVRAVIHDVPRRPNHIRRRVHTHKLLYAAGEDGVRGKRHAPHTRSIVQQCFWGEIRYSIANLRKDPRENAVFLGKTTGEVLGAEVRCEIHRLPVVKFRTEFGHELILHSPLYCFEIHTGQSGPLYLDVIYKNKSCTFSFKPRKSQTSKTNSSNQINQSNRSINQSINGLNNQYCSNQSINQSTEHIQQIPHRDPRFLAPFLSLES